jgi:transposase
MLAKPLSRAAISALPGPALTDLAVGLQEQVGALQQRVQWFERMLFGQKSERRLEANPQQMLLGELPVPAESPLPEGKTVAAHTRRPPTTDCAEGADESALFFDPARVPVETIVVPNPEAAGLAADAYEVIGEKVSHRLAQRPGSYVVLKYVRPVIKRRDTAALSCPPAPLGVLEGSRAEVSFIAGLLLDKFAYHLPLYRQHQRLTDAGFTVSRPWLTQLTHQAAALLEPIYEAQLASVRGSRVKAMDETPIKAGRAGPGKLKGGYFWPVYGEGDEVCFPFHPSREAKHVVATLGHDPPAGAVLVSDGYAAYARYAEKCGLTHAQCWAHTRRKFFDAQALEPERAALALEMIGALYAVETQIRDGTLTGDAKRAYRTQHAAPMVERFFAWVEAQFAEQGWLPSSPLTVALAYAREREAGLRVYLADPAVPIDTNHLERALRAIPMGRKAWLFCWTEVGAKYVGIVQSLITTCRLHDLDPYTYLVDVLQRVGQHPASRVAELTPRQWKTHFAANPLRSALQHG